MTVAVQSNFFEDIRVQVVDWFAKASITLPHPGDLEPVLFAYFSVKRRLISVHPREVKWSRELRARSLRDDQRAAIEGIAQQVRNGDDLTPRLSKSI
ncbi:hypothetical protein, partial [Escherichia coli]|uniref:hypothetical protein n=1 Tax=Escherichia coli TaxID=562 RepID=UPI00159BDC21